MAEGEHTQGQDKGQGQGQQVIEGGILGFGAVACGPGFYLFIGLSSEPDSCRSHRPQFMAARWLNSGASPTKGLVDLPRPVNGRKG